MAQKQLGFWNQPTLNVDSEFAEALNSAARRCRLKRDQIVEQMNALAARYGIRMVKGRTGRLTIETFEKWINPADCSRQMPVRALPVFCAVVGDYSAYDVLARPVGLTVIGPDEQRKLAWAEAYQRAREARATMRKIEQEM